MDSPTLSNTGKLVFEYRPDEPLLIVRWDGAGYAPDFPNESREILSYAETRQCWRWLLDYRIHGDTSDYNASDFYSVLFDAYHRIREEGEKLRVAILLGPGFTALPNRLPPPEHLERRRLAVRTFSDEGQALAWLKNSE